MEINNKVRRFVNLLWFHLPTNLTINYKQKKEILSITIANNTNKIIREYKLNVFDKSPDIWSMARKEATKIIKDIDDDNVKRIGKSL